MKPVPRRSARKILFAIYGVLLALCVVVITMAHISERRDQRKQAMARMGSVTSTLATQLNGNHVELILARYDGRGMLIKNTQDAWYYVLHDRLRKSAESTGSTRPLRVLAYDSLKQELQIVITSDDRPAFREPFEGDATAILASYAAGGRFASPRKEPKDLLVFDTLRDSEGRIAGIVLASAAVSEADAFALTALWRNIIIALILFAAAGIALFSSVGRWLKQDELAQNALQQRHDGITDSIAYAGKIQRALVPSPQVYNELFDGSFVIDRPKDVVSGDFHWYHRTGPDSCFVAAGDCTGHGLPGAMIAAIGCSLLNEIVPQNPGKDPAELLAMLNTRLVTTLHQQGQRRGAGDGLDIALCRIDRREHEILFAGAFRPLYWLHHGQLTVINGDRRPIGGAHQELDRRFTGHRLAYEPGDRIYLFSDGYVDQFGGPDRKRFMASRLHALLSDNQQLPMEQQAALLDEAFLAWKGDQEQVDDVCMLGLAV
ncbi:MAG: PP2C family protein-serine/threonine phosphatase [Flavobacteriales bacterium]